MKCIEIAYYCSENRYRKSHGKPRKPTESEMAGGLPGHVPNFVA